MARRAPPKLSEIISVPESDPVQVDDLSIPSDTDVIVSVPVTGTSESSRRAPPRSSAETQPSSTPAPDASSGPSVKDLLTSQLPDDDTQEKMIRSIAQNPAKITSALKQMNFDGDSVSRIVQDARSNPEMMKEIQKLSKDSGLQHQVQKSLSKGQAQGHGDGQPSRKSIMKMQREMKKAIRESSTGEKVPTVKAVWLMISRKTKPIELTESSIAQDAARKLGIGSNFELIEKNGLTFVCSTHPTHANQRNKVLEKLVGRGHGGESIIFLTNKSNLSVQQFDQKTKTW